MTRRGVKEPALIDLNHEGRILYVSMTDLSQADGPGVNEREFVFSLREKCGSRVHLLVPIPKHACPELDVKQATFYRNPWKWNFIGFLRQQVQLNKQIRRLLADRPFDLIVVRVGVMPLGFYWARTVSVPYAVKSADDSRGLANNVGLKGWVGRLLAPVNVLLHQAILGRALAVDACTKPLLRLQEEEHLVPRERLLLVGNATNVQRFSPRDQERTRSSIHAERLGPILGYAGGRPYEWGGVQMLEVACRLLKEYPRIGVVIVGDPGAKKLRKRARELGIADRVVIPGRVPYEQVPAYVNSFDICFAFDHLDRFRRVGNSYQKVRQALANGKPVITRAAADSFLFERGFAEVADPEDLDSVEKAVRRILARDESTRRLNASKAIAYAREHLSLEAALNRRVDFWNERLQGAGGNLDGPQIACGNASEGNHCHA